jgi:hypothetical protein
MTYMSLLHEINKLEVVRHLDRMSEETLSKISPRVGRDIGRRCRHWTQTITGLFLPSVRQKMTRTQVLLCVLLKLTVHFNELKVHDVFILTSLKIMVIQDKNLGEHNSPRYMCYNYINNPKNYWTFCSIPFLIVTLRCAEFCRRPLTKSR